MFNLTLTGFLEWLVAILFSPMMGALFALGLLGGCVESDATMAEQDAGMDRALTYIDKASDVAAKNNLAFTAVVDVTGEPGVGEKLTFFLETGVSARLTFFGNAAGNPGESPPAPRLPHDGTVKVDGLPERQTKADVAKGHFRR